VRRLFLENENDSSDEVALVCQVRRLKRPVTSRPIITCWCGTVIRSSGSTGPTTSRRASNE